MIRYFFAILLIMLSANTMAQAQDPEPQIFMPPELKQETVEGKVVEIIEQQEVEYYGESQTYQKLKILTDSNEEAIVEVGNVPTIDSPVYKLGDELQLLRVEDEAGKVTFYISDYVRRDPLLWLFIIFVIVVLAVSRFWGFASLLGLAYSFLIIMNFILPQLLNERSPLLITIIGAMLIAPVTFSLSHGLNKKTVVAIISTFIALLITGILAIIFINATKLIGFGTEEAYFLQVAKQGRINMQGLLLAGVVIGTLGILDDVTITQASIVARLKSLNVRLTPSQVFSEAMKVGHDHIASTVNTLVLVYTGSALPLLLLFVNSERSFSEVVNTQVIAEEILTMLVSSIGLILAIPITTLLASYIITKEDSASSHNHVH